MPLSQLQLKARIIAGSGNYEEMINYLELLRVDAGNVATDLKIENDSLELRRGIDNYLKAAIDNIRRIRKSNMAPEENHNDDV